MVDRRSTHLSLRVPAQAAVAWTGSNEIGLGVASGSMASGKGRPS